MIYGKDTGKNAESICQQSEIREHSGYYGSDESDVADVLERVMKCELGCEKSERVSDGPEMPLSENYRKFFIEISRSVGILQGVGL